MHCIFNLVLSRNTRTPPPPPLAISSHIFLVSILHVTSMALHVPHIIHIFSLLLMSSHITQIPMFLDRASVPLVISCLSSHAGLTYHLIQYPSVLSPCGPICPSCHPMSPHVPHTIPTNSAPYVSTCFGAVHK